MQLVDVNILIYAFREESLDHVRYRQWFENFAGGGEAFATAELVLSSFLRLVTNAQIFRPGTPWRRAIAFVDAIRRQPGCVLIAPGPRHWGIFVDLCEDLSATGNLVADAYLAALAIEHGCEWLTADRDFARFPGLRWRHPLD
jgi:uncharacterized protein